MEPVMIDDQQTRTQINGTQNGGRDNAGFQYDEPAVLQVNSDTNGNMGLDNPHLYQDLKPNGNSNSKASQKNGHMPRGKAYVYDGPGGAHGLGTETGQEVHEYEYGFNRQESYKYKGQTEQERTNNKKNESHCCRIFAVVIAILILLIIGAIIYVVFEFVVNKPDNVTTTQLPQTTALPPVQSYLVTTSAVATLDLTYTPSLSDPSTTEYQELEANFTSLMETALRDAKTSEVSYEEVIVISFSSGSVVVNFDIRASHTQNSLPGEAAEQAAINAVENEVSAVLTEITEDNSSDLPLISFDITGSEADIIVTTTAQQTSEIPSTPESITTQEPIACQPDEILCPDGLGCVGFDQICDGVQQCLDGYDEQLCTGGNCSITELPCLDQTECYPIDKQCDGEFDCTDESDEDSCSSCPESTCFDSGCYPFSGYCDGIPDCLDQSDELFCSSCPIGQLDCNDGGCYDPLGYCDGNQDCDDGSDELFCSTNCEPNELVCIDGSGCYVYPDQECDGISQCTDGQDEQSCTDGCRPGELPCATGNECYNAVYQCDGYQDCTDQSDEQDCTLELVVVDLTELSAPYVLTSPNYPDRYPLNANQSWLFVASFGYRPRIDVNDLYTEPIRDLLSFYSGSTPIGQPLELSGAMTRSGIITYQSSNQNLYVTFTSDNAVSVRGFNASVIQESTNDVQCDESQYDCGDGMVCMPTDKLCSCPVPPTDCNPPTDCFSCDSGKCIPFEEECDGEHQCEFGEDERNCSQRCDSFLCNDGICLANSTVCDTVNDCTGGEDESGCSYPVGEETVYLFNGDIPYQLTSYGYPAEYPNNVHYTWKFLAGFGFKIRLQFQFFSTHDANDYVIIGDGSNTSTNPFMRLYGGGFVPQEVLSQGGDIWITMVTNQNFRSSGFFANVTAVLEDEELGPCAPKDVQCGDHVCIPGERLCDVTPHCVLPSFNPGCPVFIELGGVGKQYQPMTSPFLKLYSSNFPARYDNNIDATLYLTAMAGQRILAATVQFDTEEGYDFLTFYEGHSTDPSQQIAILSGLLPNQVIMSTGNRMTIVFQSDETYALFGFYLEIEGQATDDSCSSDEFRCMNGQCRSSDLVCDGEIHCIDFSDEDKCPTCQPVPSQCSSILPWTATVFPNTRFHTESEALQRYTELESAALSCSPSSGQLLLCAALFPECPHYGTTRNLCPSVCNEVITDCPQLAEFSNACSGSTVVDDNSGNPLCEARTGDYFNTEVCGTRPAYQGDSEVQPRIIGGTYAEKGEFPWIGTLQNENGEQQCGASLLNEYWAITAAHCTGVYSSISFGYLKLDTPTNYSVSPPIAQIIDHPNYYSTSGGDDITLIRFEEPVEINDYVRPICLPSANTSETRVYRRCYAAGWGTLAFGDVASNDLLKVLLGIIDNDECDQMYGDVIPSKICAGYKSGGYDSCNGDSGGPLACEGDDGRWHLIGITSYGNLGCGDPGFPGVYTRVSSFLDFISDTIEQQDP
ncbi:atrial natriuretic peptide-converting enzyme-like isoform X9 [Lytechinus pictus]|uniref:atrial natriuretic peptide-converting enzyme-like isoform X9 n=1 Tax=Lytechinus pictus TaxID=7653 RepID=UPI0030B9F9BF